MSKIPSGKDIRSLHEKSVIFQDNDRVRLERPVSAYTKPREIKTYQDSNIFGWKDASSKSITKEAKKTIDDPVKKIKVRENPTFGKSTITEHFYDEESERIKEERKKRRNDPKSSSIDGAKEFIRMAEYPSPNLAFSKKLQELQGSTLENPNVADRNVENMQKVDKLHASNAKWTDVSTQRKFANKQNVKQENFSQYANTRKTVELQSDIFHLSKEVERNNISIDEDRKKGSKPLDFGDHYNEELRRKDQRYSDIFGSENLVKNNEKYTSTPVKRSLKVPTNADWKDSNTEQMTRSSGKKNSTLNPTQKKLEQLACTIFYDDDDKVIQTTQETTKSKTPIPLTNQTIEAKVETNVPKDGLKIDKKDTIKVVQKSKEEPKTPVEISKKPEKKNNIEILEFDLRGISKNIDREKLNSLFIGYSVIELKPDVNRLNGKFLGSGTVKIANDKRFKVQELKSKLKSEGILLLNHYERLKKKDL